MIRPRKWFWSKKKLFYWRAVFAGMQFIRGRNCNQCNLFKPGGMKIQMKNSHGFINGYIERWDLLCWWQVWDIGDKSRLQHQDSRFNIQEPGILVYCDVGDWLECHQHLKFPTNITMSPTSLSPSVPFPVVVMQSCLSSLDCKSVFRVLDSFFE